MVISDSILTGFKSAITDKVIGFGSHIQIASIEQNSSLESKPIAFNSELIQEIRKEKNVKHFQSFILKGALSKTKNSIEPVVMKGIDRAYDFSFLKKALISGSIPQFSEVNKQNAKVSNNVIVSKKWIEKSGLKLGNSFLCYFVQNPARIRKYTIVAIYETGMEDFDSKIVFCDIGQLQKINSWQKNEIAGLEILLTDANEIEKTKDLLYQSLPANLNVMSIQDLYPQIFDWLNLQDTNVVVIWSIMLLVGMLNIITVLLVLILEKTSLVGILDSLGMRKASIKNIFILLSANIGIKGLLWGNAISLTMIFLQMKFKIISLDPSSYYVDYVPVVIDWYKIIQINILTFALCIFSMLIPVRLIERISTIRAIQFR